MRPLRWARLATFVVIGAVVSRPARAQDLAAAGRLLEEGKAAAARPAIAAEYAANPKAGTSAYWMGRLLMEEGKDDAAADRFEDAVKADPNNSMYYTWLGRAYGRQAQKANMLSKASLAGKTKGAWEKAIALDPNNLEARDDIISYYLQAPGIMGGSKEKAFAEVAEIKKRDVVRGALKESQVYQRDKNWAGAEQAIAAGLKQKPDTMPLVYALGYLFQNQQQWDRAFDHFERRYKAHPEEWGALFQVGRTGAMSGQRLDRAEQALTAYLKAAPTSKELPQPYAAHFRLGQVLEHKGDAARAKAEYQTAVQLKPDFKPAQDALKKIGG